MSEKLEQTGEGEDARELLRQGRAAEAVPLLQQAADRYAARGDLARASQLYQLALDACRSVGPAAELEAATLLDHLARVDDQAGRFEQAQSSLRAELEIHRTHVGAQDEQYAEALTHLAAVHLHASEWREAEDRYKEALAIRRRNLGDEHPRVADVLYALGDLYRLRGQVREAEDAFRSARRIHIATYGRLHADVATDTNGLATVYRAVGNLDSAESLYREALEITRATGGESDPLCAAILGNLATIHQARHQYDQAKQMYLEAIEVFKHVPGDNRREMGFILGNLASMHLEASEFFLAYTIAREASVRLTSVLGQQHPGVSAVLATLAECLAAAGLHREAVAAYGDVVSNLRGTRGEQHPYLAAALGNAAASLAALGDIETALSLMLQAASIDDHTIGQVFTFASERERMAHLDSLRGRFNGFLSLILRYLRASQPARAAAYEMVARRKRLGAEALAVQRETVLGGAYPALAGLLAELIEVRRRIGQRTIAGPGQDGLDAHQQQLREWHSRREQLEADLARQIPEMDLARRMRAADLSAIAEALPEEAVLVEYVRFETFDFDAVRQRGEPTWRPARYAAFVLRVDNPAGVELIDLGEGEQVEELIRRFRTAITREQERRHGGPPEQEVSIGEQPKPSAREAGEALRAALFDPLQPVLGGRTRLIVAPDGELARIPFEVLPVGQSRLIDTYLISYVATGRDVLRFGASTGLSRNRALVCADPDFDLGVSTATATRVEPQFQQSRDLQQNLSGFERLEGTRTEGQQVAELLAVEPLLGQAVLETTVKQCRGPYVLHLATHGFFLPEQKAEPLEHQSVLQGDAAWWSRLAHLENPLLRSGLALAGANTARRGGALPNEAEDGLLTAADVTALDLIGTQLVVLSACETGLGEIRVGEGVFGLRRAFSVAGAQTVVMSLWKVPDEQTRALMQDFYLRLQAGEGRATALREAQLTMKRRTDHPLFWGGFICEGEPGPLRDDADEKQAELRAPTRITTDGV